LSRRVFSIRDIDWATAALYLSLAIIGWFMVDAAVFDPNHPTSIFDLNTQSGKQGLFVLISIVVGAAILLVDPQLFKTLSYLIYGVSIVLLVGVMVYGVATNGATSWIDLPGGFKFQPSEIAKFATCLALATYLSSVNASMEAIENVVVSLAIILVPTALIVIQGDPGSALVFLSLFIVLFREGLHPIIYILGIIFVTLFVVSLVFDPLFVILGMGLIATAISISNLKSKAVWSIAFLGLLIATYFLYKEHTLNILYAVGAFLLISIIANIIKQKRMLATFLITSVTLMSAFAFSVNYLFYEVLEPHQQDRLNVWLMPEKADPRGSYYNLLQSKLAIGSGGFQGKGHRKGEMTQGNYVPEQHTDFIFTVVGEEQGFIGTFAVIALYLMLLLRITILAERQRSKFTRVYAYGVAGILSFHLLVNVGMTMGLMPVIGIPLPLMSYGGSSLLSFTVMIAVLIKFDSQRLLVFR
jgi:rod shape determining protein RodA